MLPDGPPRRLLSDDLPFAPAPGSGAGRARPGAGGRAAGWSPRWRLPVTVLVGALVVVTAFFAWQTQRDHDRPQQQATAGRDDPMVAAVAGLKRNPNADQAVSPPPVVPPATDSPVVTGANPAGSASTALAAPATSRPPARPTTVPAGNGTGPVGTGPSGSATTGGPGSTGQKLVYIGDVVTYDDWNGPGVGGITITLQADANRDGKGEATKATTISSASAGTYNFQADPGCYVVVFSVPAGQTVLKGSATNPVCLAAGESNARVDLVISRPVKPPAACTVIQGNRPAAGIQVQPDSSNAFAPSYAWYDGSGKLIRSTSSLGPPDWNNTFPRYIGWSVQRYRYDPAPVVSVAAEDGRGGTSPRVTCARSGG